MAQEQIVLKQNGLKLFNQQITNVKTQEYLQSILGDKKDVFVANLTSLVASNEKLQECEPMTVMYAALKATSLDLPLDPNLGFAYVLPYADNKNNRMVAQLQFGYRAIVQLAIRSGQFERINVTDIREGELKGFDRRTGEVWLEWIEDEKERDKAPVVGYLGYFKLLNGYKKESYWTVEELKKHATRYSQTYGSEKEYIRNSSKWTTDFDAMATKTVLKLMLNKGDAPMSVQMQQAIKFDQAVIKDEKDNIEYVDSQEPAAAAATATPEEANKAGELFK